MNIHWQGNSLYCGKIRFAVVYKHYSSPGWCASMLLSGATIIGDSRDEVRQYCEQRLDHFIERLTA